jgi:para-aminobenzoate synthetase/4-amino-4-deoxychorismate lyase
VTELPSPSAIVDFPGDDGVSPRRLRFSEPLRVWRVETDDQVISTLDEVDRAARAGAWIVGFVSYEAASAFDRAFARAAACALPLAWFAEFAAPLPTVGDGADRTDAPSEPGEGSVLEPDSGMPESMYAEAVRRIHAYIDAGDVYQVNLTVPFTSPVDAPLLTLYERMRRAQGGAYSCLLDIGEAQILSASPELFFQRRGDRIHSRPMKGTARRGPHPVADVAARDALLRSEKERAENVMIVDVVRNDLGRIARLGSVQVGALCRVERYPSVWQLTSSVQADVEPDAPLGEVFRALFPPASVTGAPKIRAASIIRELEVAPREVYCGAVGLVQPGGDATFNVAIRTAWTRHDGMLHLNAGGGITADSTAPAELREVRAKLTAFTRPVEKPGLFETIRVERGVAIRLERHLHRLATSADYFAIPFEPGTARRVLDESLRDAGHVALARARLELAASGALSADWHPHHPDHRSAPLPVSLAPAPIERADVRCYHKCVDRSRYDGALAAAPGMFDVILWNADGEATELTRGNLVAELDGLCVTPPIACGLLGGTLRAELLERGELAERVITLDDVGRADRLWFVNSLRGRVPIVLERSPRHAAGRTVR